MLFYYNILANSLERSILIIDNAKIHYSSEILEIYTIVDI